jgi:uncharacterized integral membrane protein
MGFRLTLIMALLLAVVLFTLQNTEMVNIQFFIWNYEISRALLIFLSFAAGLLLGLIVAGLQYRKNKRPDPPRPQEDSHEQHTTP